MGTEKLIVGYNSKTVCREISQLKTYKVFQIGIITNFQSLVSRT